MNRSLQAATAVWCLEVMRYGRPLWLFSVVPAATCFEHSAAVTSGEEGDGEGDEQESWGH